MSKKIVDTSTKSVRCEEISFSGGKLDGKVHKTFTIILDESLEEIYHRAANDAVIELQSLRDLANANEKRRDLPDVIKASEIAAYLGKGGPRKKMSEEAMLAQLLGKDISEITPAMVSMFKDMAKKKLGKEQAD